MSSAWKVILVGGAYHGWEGVTEFDLPELLVAWVCSDHSHCQGHVSRDPHDPGIDLRTAEAYRRSEVDLDERRAVYRVGEPNPDGLVEEDERELVGVGTGDLGYGWPVSARAALEAAS